MSSTEPIYSTPPLLDTRTEPPTINVVQKDLVFEPRPLPDENAASQGCSLEEIESPIWRDYMTEATDYDRALIDAWNSDMDVLLIFAGLFSAILTAFLVSQAGLGGLQDDPQTTLLAAILQQMQGAADNSVTTAALTGASSSPSSSVLRVNLVWFTSLSSSLIAALGAMLGKQWVREYSAGLSGSGSAHVKALKRQERYLGLRRWRMPEVLAFLPTFMHLSLFLFFIGLIDLLWSLTPEVAILVTTFFAVCTLLYITTLLLPIFDPDCPFKTSLSKSIASFARRFIVHSPIDHDDGAKERQEELAAHSMAWMLNASSEVKVVTSAITSLPVFALSEAQQAILLEGNVIGVLTRVFKECLSPKEVKSMRPDQRLLLESKTGTVLPCLIAIARLLRPTRTEWYSLQQEQQAQQLYPYQPTIALITGHKDKQLAVAATCAGAYLAIILERSQLHVGLLKNKFWSELPEDIWAIALFSAVGKKPSHNTFVIETIATVVAHFRRAREPIPVNLELSRLMSPLLHLIRSRPLDEGALRTSLSLVRAYISNNLTPSIPDSFDIYHYLSLYLADLSSAQTTNAPFELTYPHDKILGAVLETMDHIASTPIGRQGLNTVGIAPVLLRLLYQPQLWSSEAAIIVIRILRRLSLDIQRKSHSALIPHLMQLMTLRAQPLTDPDFACTFRFLLQISPQDYDEDLAPIITRITSIFKPPDGFTAPSPPEAREDAQMTLLPCLAYILEPILSDYGIESVQRGLLECLPHVMEAHPKWIIQKGVLSAIFSLLSRRAVPLSSKTRQHAIQTIHLLTDQEDIARSLSSPSALPGFTTTLSTLSVLRPKGQLAQQCRLIAGSYISSVWDSDDDDLQLRFGTALVTSVAFASTFGVFVAEYHAWVNEAEQIIQAEIDAETAFRSSPNAQRRIVIPDEAQDTLDVSISRRDPRLKIELWLRAVVWGAWDHAQEVGKGDIVEPLRRIDDRLYAIVEFANESGSSSTETIWDERIRQQLDTITELLAPHTMQLPPPIHPSPT